MTEDEKEMVTGYGTIYKITWCGVRVSWKVCGWTGRFQCQRAATEGISEVGTGYHPCKIDVVGACTCE